ncbi:hypothetical protein ABPG72_020149 [Tetrahymena utriculariae]
MQINKEENNSQFNNEQQRNPQSNLIEIQQLIRSRRVFVYWTSQELKNQFIHALEQETTVQFEEYSHLDENEQLMGKEAFFDREGQEKGQGHSHLLTNSNTTEQFIVAGQQRNTKQQLDCVPRNDTILKNFFALRL